MAALSFPAEVGDTVYVNYPVTTELYWDVQTEVVARINFSGAGEIGVISFVSGRSVSYTDAVPTVFTAQAAAAVAQLDDVISRSAANAVLDTGTTSLASTASQAFTTLGRVS